MNRRRRVLRFLLAALLIIAATAAPADAGRWKLGDTLTAKDFNEFAGRVGCAQVEAESGDTLLPLLRELVACLVRNAGGSEDDQELIRLIVDTTHP